MLKNWIKNYNGLRTSIKVALIGGLITVSLITIGGVVSLFGVKTTDYKEINYETLQLQEKNKEITVAWYDKGAEYVYFDSDDGKIKERFINPKTKDFNKEITIDSGLRVRALSDKNFADVMFRGFRTGIISLYMNFLLIILIKVGFDYVIYRVKHGDEDDSVNTYDKLGVSGTVYKGLAKDEKHFTDIAGLYEVKEDMKCLVDFIVHKKKYIESGAKLPKGVILYGPPGTGKTLLAKAVACEAKVEFLYMNGSDFVEKYVGVGAKRVRELFNRARSYTPCIIFIDEIDSIGGSRAKDADNSGEDRKVINALLTEMDGFKELDDILVIGATNRIEDLDEALLRPGRFTNKYHVPIPSSAKERREVLDIYTKNKYLGDDVNLDDLAKETIGFSPAKIEALLNEAAIIQVQEGRNYITKEVIDSAMTKMLLNGHIKKDQTGRNREELEVVAWHEAGHAIMGYLNGKDIPKVTIMSSTTGAGGVTFSLPLDSNLQSKTELYNEVKELYGGRIGELLYFNGDEDKITVGASNDIERATDIIMNCVSRFGMDKELGLLNVEHLGGKSNFLTNRCSALAHELEKETLDTLTKYSFQLESLAKLLLDKETIYTEDIQNIMNRALNSVA